MATNATGLVEKLKGAALRVGTEGVRVVVEGTVAAVKAMDQLQERLKQERVVRRKREPARGASATARQREEPALERPRPAPPVVGRPAKEVRAQARATAARVLEEARAVEERLKEARPAPQPLKASDEERPTAPKR
ncbi:MAG: hypothetical protein ACXU86_22845, partial [Archangium sp.]